VVAHPKVIKMFEARRRTIVRINKILSLIFNKSKRGDKKISSDEGVQSPIDSFVE
jgi:hypothetical protein